MGLLDDAIREHLELKRRRGADPSEVDRAEREALGPVRRGPEEPPAAFEDEPGDYDYETQPYEGDDEYEDGEQWDDAPQASEEDYEAAPAPAPAPEALHPHEATEGRPPPEAPPLHFADDPEAGTLPHHAPPGEALEDELDETAEHELRREGEPQPPSDEDVLEETPEFLQDTPDHDRLWFEQKPPRDFDFDG